MSARNAAPGTSTHESFLRHGNFRWAKAAGGLVLFALVGYLFFSVPPRPYGGTWFGYTLGSIGAGLIVWLALLGIRKRRINPGNWSLKAWTSAHVYLGLALVVVATLHSGFHFGLNVHTLAYALTLLVVLSGMFGVAAYATLPKALAASREELTQPQMVDALRAIDRQLDEAAQPLSHDDAEWVVVSLAEQPFKDGLRTRLAGAPRRSPTRVALAMLGERDRDGPRQRVAALLARRLTQLERIRHQQRLRALLEVWLYIHVPATVALLAALSAHVISEFYYW